MPDAALIIAILALLIALSARFRAASHASRLDDLERDLERQTRNLSAETEQSLALQRRMLAKLASGEELDAEMIEEGRLWKDVTGPQALSLVQQDGAHVLDVRTPQETAGGHAEDAILIPIEELETRARELPDDGKPIVVYCAAGVRSAAACDYLSSKGHDGLHNLAGGFPSWTGSHAKS